MMGYYGDGWYGMGGFGWLFMIIFWGAVIWFIIWIINKTQQSRGNEKTPAAILKERYDKGEMTKKEYEAMRKELS